MCGHTPATAGMRSTRCASRRRAAACNLRYCEKPLHGLDRAARVLFLGRMAEIIEDDERAAGDVAVEAFGVVGRKQAVAPAPDDEGRQLQFRNARGERAGWPFAESLDKRAAVASALHEFDGTIDH